MNRNRTFYIKKDYYDDGQIFDKKCITFKPGFTTLVGCNGSGKTTILMHVKEKLEKEKVPVVYFNNLNDGGSNALSKAGFYGNMDFLMEGLVSSEGENIVMNLGEISKKVGLAVRNCINNKNNELWILLDAIDSGLSIDNIVGLKEMLFMPVLEDCEKENINVFIIAAANEYELVRDSMPFDAIGCEYISIKNYDEYHDFILSSAKKKEKRYKQK